MQDIIGYSLERKNLALKFWEESSNVSLQDGCESDVGHVTKDTLADWLITHPITNEETHFGAIMDAKDGKVVWAERYLEPLDIVPSEETDSEVSKTSAERVI